MLFFLKQVVLLDFTNVLCNQLIPISLVNRVLRQLLLNF